MAKVMILIEVKLNTDKDDLAVENAIKKGIQQKRKTVILFGKFILFLQSNHSRHSL